MQNIVLAFLILSCLSCRSKETCNLGAPLRIQSIYGSNNGVVSYSHEVQLKGVSLKCDSTSIMAAINKYLESNSKDMPVSDVQVFSSRENYDSGESLSQPKEYWNDLVVSVHLDTATNKPESFVFYSSGRKIYEGKRWKQ